MTSGKLSFIRKVPEVGWFLLLYLAWRLVYLLFAPYQDFGFHDEELFRGAIAKEILRGLTFPLMAYRPDDYSGGWLVVSLITVPFFRIFGPTLFALKMTPLLIFGLALWCWYQVLSRHVNLSAARIFALLFIFSPPSFTQFTLNAMGYHSESMVFSALGILLFLEFLHGGKNRIRAGALFGLVSGLGLWFNYMYGITLASLLLYGFWEDRSLLRKRGFGACVIGFVVGFSPWIYNNTLNHYAGLMIEAKPLWKHFSLYGLLDGFVHLHASGIFQILASFNPWNWPGSLVFTPNRVYGVLLGILLVMRWRGVSWHKLFRPRPDGGIVMPRFELLMITTIGLYALTVQTSDFRDTRFLIAAMPFVFALVASALAHLAESSNRVARRASAGMLCAFVSAGIVLGCSLFQPAIAGQIFSAKGYSYGYVPNGFFMTPDSLLRYYRRLSAHLDRGDDFELSTVLASSLSDDWVSTHRGVEGVGALADQMQPMFRRYFFYSLGQAILSSAHSDRPLTFQLLEPLKSYDPSDLRLAQTGALDMLDNEEQPRSFQQLQELVQFATQTPRDGISAAAWRSVGYQYAQIWYPEDRALACFADSLKDQLLRVPAGAQEEFMRGVGGFLFQEWFAHIARCPFQPAVLEGLPGRFQPFIFEGAGAAFSMVWGKDYASRLGWCQTLFLQRIQPTNRARFLEGTHFRARVFEN